MQEKIKVLMVGHGRKLLFWKNAGKSRVGEFETGFLYQIYTNFLGFWAVTWLVEKIVKYDLVNRT